MHFHAKQQAPEVFFFFFENRDTKTRHWNIHYSISCLSLIVCKLLEQQGTCSERRIANLQAIRKPQENEIPNTLDYSKDHLLSTFPGFFLFIEFYLTSHFACQGKVKALNLMMTTKIFGSWDLQDENLKELGIFTYSLL